MALSSMTAIKRYFESEPYGRKVTMDELKSLSQDDRNELGQACAAALGEEWTPPAQA